MGTNTTLKGANSILLSMVFALICGIGINFVLTSWPSLKPIYISVDKYFIGLIGDIFLKLLLVAIIPLVFVALAGGMLEIGDDVAKLRRIGGKALLYYFLTTLAAVIIGVVLALVIKPGSFTIKTGVNATIQTSSTGMSAASIILEIFPKNPFAALAEGHMLQIIVVALLFGYAVSKIGGKEGKIVKRFVHYFMALMVSIVNLVMKIAPIGVFCLLVKVIATQGYTTIFGLLFYILTVLLGLTLLFIFVYTPILIFIIKIHPLKFLKKFYPVCLMAFATSSSKATLPIAMDICQAKFGVHKKIVSFLMPLGASINMNGAAIMQAVATIFIAQVYNIHLPLSVLLSIIFIAIFTPAGAAGIPSGATLMLTSILMAAGIPIEGIALILGVDRIVDMCRTVVNISGDFICAIAVAKSENEINEADLYNLTPPLVPEAVTQSGKYFN